MAESVAQAKFVRMSARKVRLVADLIRGRKVSEARDILAVQVKAGGPLVGKVLASAVANAESKAAETRKRINTDDMVVTKVLVDGGPTMRRSGSASRGRRVMIRKRTSHIRVEIADNN